jgi:sec-independent protein translocase protein TatA
MGIFGNTFGLPHLIIILVIILLLFGAPKLPGLAKSLGQSMKIFRTEIKAPKDESVTAEETTAEQGAPTQPTGASTEAQSKPKP